MKLTISTLEDAQRGQVLCLREHSKDRCSAPSHSAGCPPNWKSSFAEVSPLCILIKPWHGGVTRGFLNLFILDNGSYEVTEEEEEGWGTKELRSVEYCEHFFSTVG